MLQEGNISAPLDARTLGAGAGVQPAPDRDAITQHFNFLFERLDDYCDGLIEIAYSEHSGAPSRAHLFDFDDLAGAADFAIEQNERGVNVYVAPALRLPETPRNGRASDAAFYASGVAWIDADRDVAAVEAALAAEGIEPSLNVITGTVPERRAHFYVSLDVACDNAVDLKAANEGLQRLTGADAVSNASRLLRLAGTVSHPSEKKCERGYVTESVTVDAMPGRSVSAERLHTLQGASKSVPVANEQPSERGRTDNDLDTLLASIGPDNWHNPVRDAVASMAGRGWSDWQIRKILAPYCNGGADDPDLLKLLEGARHKYRLPDPGVQSAILAPQSNNLLPLVWTRDIEVDFSRSYVIKGLLDSTAMSVVYGQSNVGKSFFAIDIAWHVAAGMPWRELRVNQGAVVYVAAESGESVLRRVMARRQEHGSVEVPLAVIPVSVDLLNPTADTQRLIDAILAAGEECAQPVTLVVVDTLSRSFGGGDENTSKDMTGFVANIDRIRTATDAHVLVVHHAGKDDARGARGHSSLRAATDTEISIKRAENNEFSIASVDKQRDGQGGDKHPFELKTVELGVDPDGDPITTAVVVHQDQSVGYAGPRLSARQQEAKSALFQHWLEDGKGGPGGISFDEFRELMVDRGILEKDTNRFKQKMSELRQGLGRKGVLQVRDKRVHLIMAVPEGGENAPGP